MLNDFLGKLQSGAVLSPGEIENYEKEFRSFSMEEKEELWANLHAYFKSASAETDQKYWWSYFRWYTELSWTPLINRDREFVSTIAIPRQLPMALLSGIDVWREFLWYLNTSYFRQGEMASFYSTVRDNTFKSPSILGTWKGQKVTIAQMIKELSIANQEKNTLKIAEAEAKLGEILFAKDVITQEYLAKYCAVDLDDVVGGFTEMAHFLLGVQPDGIEAVVEVTIHEEKYDLLQESQQKAPAAGTQPTPSSLPKKVLLPPTVPQAPKPLATPPTQKPIIQPPVQKLTRPSNQEIRKMVESVFPAASKDYKGMVAMLNTLAEKYGDDSIRELYVFNEQTGLFEWNQTLLR